ncbi:polyprenyl synthetase family protein [Aurantivibrio infirmus]
MQKTLLGSLSTCDLLTLTVLTSNPRIHRFVLSTDSWMLPFHQVVKNDFADVNQLIIDQLHSDVDLVENIGHYLVEAGGKRLRPLLVLLTSNALASTESKEFLKLAAIIEFIHTATLLHDDVVDVSSLRRGRLTANAKWGNAPSVLVGDFLYSRAFQLMVEIGNMKIMNILADTTNIISEGEVQQLVNAKNPDVSEDVYMEVIYKKTAILFSAACETAAVLAQSTHKKLSSSDIDALKQYGFHVGMAFQLVDDVLDYSGDAETLGKNIGDDLSEGKPTLPLIVAMRHAEANDAEIIANALRNGSSEQLNKIVSIVQENNGLTYTQDKAKYHVDQALNCLNGISDSEYSQAMKELANFAISRSY